MSAHVAVADCLEAMARLAPASVDAIVTDPPYGIRFMGQAWDGTEIVRRAATLRSKRPRPDGRAGDYSLASAAGEYDRSPEANRAFQAWATEWAAAVLAVAKPGAHLVAFGGPRTFHRLGCALEDAGWDIRDTLSWLYGQGFPKSLDVAKAIDRAAGAARENKFAGAFVRRAGPTGNRRCGVCRKWLISGDPCRCPRPQDRAVTDAGRPWDGWGTGLKPAWEPILLARKPSDATVAETVLRYGTGALHVDACRLPTADNGGNWGHSNETCRPRFNASPEGAAYRTAQHEFGRWPPNVALDAAVAAALDRVVGDRPSTLTGRADPTLLHPPVSDAVSGGIVFTTPKGQGGLYADLGGPSRFFYCPKASRAEREEGLEGFGARPGVRYGQAVVNGSGGLINGTGERTPTRNPHPTVKPVALMRWLVRLVTPPGGLVLDPFCGSGTTGVACALEGMRFLGIEREADYAAIARARISRARMQPSLFDPPDPGEDPAQTALFDAV